jgi:hypothetical protein
MALGTTVFGRARIIVTADGDSIPGEVERMGEQGGARGGKAFAKSFDKAAGNGLKKSLGNFKKSFDAWDKNLGRDNSGMSRITRQTRAFFKTLGNTEPMLRFRLGLSSLAEKFREVGDNAVIARRNTEHHISLWKRLSHNTRQWTLIIGAVAAGMEGLSVMGAALGPALIVAASGLSQLVIGGLAAVPIFVRLLDDIEDLPPALRPVAKEFQDFTASFEKFTDSVATSAFKEMPGAFDTLRETVSDLTPAFAKVGRSIGKLIKGFAEGTKKGTEGFEEINELVENASEFILDLGKIAGKFGLALVRAFNRANPLTEKFVGYLGELVDKFDEFTQSDQFDEWIRHAEDVFGAFKDLLGDVFTVLNNLVTDESVERFVTFTDNLGKFLTGGGEDLLQFLGELDIFGVLAKALADFGEALAPLAEPMSDLAAAVKDILEAGIDTLSPVLEAAATALAPLVQSLADFMAANPEAIGAGFVTVAGGILALKGISAVTGSLGAFITKMDDLVRKAPTWKTGLAGFTSGIVASLTTITSEDQVTLNSFASNIVGGLLLGFTFGGPFGALVAGLTAFVGTAIKDALDGGSYALDAYAFKPGDPFYDLVEGWGNMLTDWRDEDWIPFWDGLGSWITTAVEDWGTMLTTWRDQDWTPFWEGLVTTVQDESDKIVTRWDQTLKDMKRDFNTWANQVTVGFGTFWAGLIAGVTSRLALLRIAFIVGFALVRAQWNSFWDGLATKANEVVGGIKGLIGGIVSAIQTAINLLQTFLNLRSQAAAGGGGAGGGGGGLASGGMVYGPRRFLVGEAGPEAVVPLNRSLSQVDPSVRWLSAIAQGKMPGLAGGGIVGGRSLTVSDGAIIIQEAGDPRRAANAVIQRLVEYANG